MKITMYKPNIICYYIDIETKQQNKTKEQTMNNQDQETIVRFIDGLSDELLLELWSTMIKNTGGVQNIDTVILKAFFNRFQENPELLNK
tara:strand:- start:568 stop:834 length:267 start_codon:yes stop_codon:yes gene_type:complete